MLFEMAMEPLPWRQTIRLEITSGMLEKRMDVKTYFEKFIKEENTYLVPTARKVRPMTKSGIAKV